MADGKTQTRSDSSRLGGKEWIEDSVHILRWNATPIVAHFDEHSLVVHSGAKAYLVLRVAQRQGLGRIYDQIQKDLTKPSIVPGDRRNVVVLALHASLVSYLGRRHSHRSVKYAS